MPKSRSKRSNKPERKIKISVEPIVISNDANYEATYFQFKEYELNTLNGIAAVFPKIIQKILLDLSYPTHKILRLTSKPLKQAVEQYIGMSVILTETQTDYEISNKIQIINKDLQNALKYIGIRHLKGIQLTKTNFFEIVTFPYLLQSINLFGQIDQHILLGILKECWNLRTLKLQEPNQFQMLVRGNFLDFMRSFGSLIEKRKAIRLERLKFLKIQCSTTSTMGYLLVILSALEARSLESLHCCIGPVHADFYPLITGVIVNVLNTAHKTLNDFWLVVESNDAYPEITAKRRFLRKLNIFNEDFAGMLPRFEETLKKLYWNKEEKDEWLKSILSSAGARNPNLLKIRLDIDTVDDFANYWIHFLNHQKSLSTLEIQACCHWSLVENIIKQNSKTLDTLGIIMEFHAPMDLQALLGGCTMLRRLILKNFDFDWMSAEQLEMRRTGHLVNAKFDELFPQLEHLALSNLHIHSTDLSRVTRMQHLKDFVLSLLEMDAENGDFTEPNNMFGLLKNDFIDLLYKRNLNHIVISKEAIVCCGPLVQRLQEFVKLEAMLDDPMFHATNILGWRQLDIDEEHIAVAHGDTVSMSDWIFPLIMSVIEDTVATDVISFRSLVIDDNER